MPIYPGDPAVDVWPAATMAEDGYRVSGLSLSSHTGTHVDAPSHLLGEGRSIGRYPLETFRFDVVRVDCPDVEPREPIDAGTLAAAEPDPDADLLAVRTGWDEQFWTPGYRDHPFLALEAAEWCADREYHVGIDAPSVDASPGPRGDGDPVFPAHHALLGAGLLIVENLRDLGSPPDRFTLHAYPLPVDTDGAPVRAVAETDEADDPVDTAAEGDELPEPDRGASPGDAPWLDADVDENRVSDEGSADADDGSTADDADADDDRTGA